MSIRTSLTDTWLVGTAGRNRQPNFGPILDLGVTHFMLWFMDAPADAGYASVHAEQVAPAVRAAT